MIFLNNEGTGRYHNWKRGKSVIVYSMTLSSTIMIISNITISKIIVNEHYNRFLKSPTTTGNQKVPVISNHLQSRTFRTHTDTSKHTHVISILPLLDVPA
jgi:hypothetical protein